MEYENLKLENQICHRLYIASNKLTRLYRPLLDKLDLTYPQYIIMMALWEKQTYTFLELAKVTKIDKGSLSTIIKKLETKNIINIEQDEIDKRKKHISLTKQGKALKKKAVSIPEEIACQSNISLDDYKKLKELLDQLNTSIK